MSRPQAFSSAVCVFRRRPLKHAPFSLRPDLQSARRLSALHTPSHESLAHQQSMAQQSISGLNVPASMAAAVAPPTSVPLDGLHAPRQPTLAVPPPTAASSSARRHAMDPFAKPFSAPIPISKAKKNTHPVQPPSAASGGIPDPSPDYLAQSLLPPTVLPEPRRILVVLDLNGTILYRPNSRLAPRHYVERPYAKAFLRYCLDIFRVVIWSSARTHNVSAMVNRIMDQDMRQKVVAVWSRDHFGLTPYDFASNTQCYKRLTRVWQDPIIGASHPSLATGGKWNQTNTVLVDDSTEKARSEPHNLLCVPEFAGDDSLLGADVIPQVHDYLNSLAHQADISQYIRQNPFTLNPTISAS